MTTRRPGAPRAPKTPGGVDAPVRRPGAPAGPSTDTAEGIGKYVTEVLTRLGDERDVYRDALRELLDSGHLDARDRAAVEEALRRGRTRTW